VYTIYLIECKTPNHYYIGQTADIGQRIKRHLRGTGAAFVKRHGFSSWSVLDTAKNLAESKAKELGYYRELCADGVIAGGPYPTDLLGNHYHAAARRDAAL
jgi:hypothetical protein